MVVFSLVTRVLHGKHTGSESTYNGKGRSTLITVNYCQLLSVVEFAFCQIIDN